MPPREQESKIVFPKWMWGLGISVVGWAGHQSIEIAVVRSDQKQILSRIESLEEKAWELRGTKREAHTAQLPQLR